MSADEYGSEEELLQAVSRWRNQAVSRWAEAVSNSVVAAELKMELQDLADHYKGLARERDLLADRVVYLEHRVSDMMRSTSWRVTGPLRFVSGLIARPDRRV